MMLVSLAGTLLWIHGFGYNQPLPHFVPACGDLAVYFFLTYLFLRHSKLYTWAALSSPLFKPLRLLGTLILVGASLVALKAFLNGIPPGFFGWVVWRTMLSFVLLWSGRLFLRWLIMNRLKLIPQERIAFLGWSLRLERVLKGLQKEIGRFQTILGYFDSPNPHAPRPDPASGYVSLGPLAGLEDYHERENITLLVVDEATLNPATLREVTALCSRSVITFRIIPSAFEILIKRLSSRIVAGVPLLGIQGVPLDLYHNRMAKRTVDIVGALVGLLLSGPVILILTFLIKRESPGPAFYRQERLGRAGRPFKIIKLRSMRLDAEKAQGAQWAVADDPRRLKIGAFMRRTNLDETPQFWNVLKGEMSLVGPRPERPQFVETFSHDVRHYNLRHNCKPGLTSWAAVHGLRGSTSLTDRLDYDLYYFENWSLWLDFKTMLMTLLPPKNAY